MKTRMTFLLAGLLMIGGAVVALGTATTPTEATICQPLCAPCEYGGSCSCSSYVVPNVRCLKDGGGAGVPVVTTCISCGRPCDPGEICNLELCRTRSSVSCV